MILHQTSARYGPSLLIPGCDAILDSVRQNQNFLLSAWGQSIAATRRFREDVRPLVHQLMQYLLAHTSEGARMDHAFIDDFLALVIKAHPPLRVADVLHLLADYEEILVTLSCQILRPSEVEHAYYFAHELCSRVTSAFAEHACLPIGPDEAEFPSTNPDGSSPFLSSLLRVLGLSELWPWLAVVETQPKFRLIDFTTFDQTAARWTPAKITKDVTDMVLQFIAPDSRQTVLPLRHWQLVAPDMGDPMATALYRQVGRWIRFSLAMVPASSNAISPRTNATLQSTMTERLLDFDEHLLAAHDVSEVLSAVATDACKVCGFERSALFLYNPLTESVEGIYGHHLNLDEVRQIRESVRSIPIIHHVTQFSRTLYFSDASLWLPKHYVSHFHLTSLLACPIQGPYGQAVGVLLLDQAGKPFQADESLQQTMDMILKRTTLALTKHLQYAGNAVQPANRYGLTARELDILQLIADGLDTSSTAKRLHISDYTVTEHMTAIFRKLKVRNRTQAVAKVLREGIIR